MGAINWNDGKDRPTRYRQAVEKNLSELRGIERYHANVIASQLGEGIIRNAHDRRIDPRDAALWVSDNIDLWGEAAEEQYGVPVGVAPAKDEHHSESWA